MARVLVVQHTAREGLGNLAEWLPAVGLDVHPIHPYLGHRVPPSVEGDALIVLGGPTSVYDDEAAPWLPGVRSLLATAVDDGVPTLGICLGAQLLARAAGGHVDAPGRHGPELGLGLVEVGGGDALLEPGSLQVVQAHSDAVATLPPGAELLASSGQYANQAFRVGELAWGLQFHIEATTAMAEQWLRSEAAALSAAGRELDTAIAEVAAAQVAIRATGEAIAHRFAAIVTG